MNGMKEDEEGLGDEGDEEAAMSLSSGLRRLSMEKAPAPADGLEWEDTMDVRGPQRLLREAASDLCMFAKRKYWIIFYPCSVQIQVKRCNVSNELARPGSER